MLISLRLPPCNAASKRYHLYQLWKSYIKKSIVLVGPTLGAALAIDFAVNYPEALFTLKYRVLEGTDNLAKLPKIVAYAGGSPFMNQMYNGEAGCFLRNTIIKLTPGVAGRLCCHILHNQGFFVEEHSTVPLR
ncbi:hypothetical protein Patl1_11267 [Pistacia atlantica]|uniref:Uncharacterized protein n=1 Tax=Pistacia atlantica TaxID=434234 RepID=A0ACC1A4I6_9ROSI|nr:hypothetical protein Patl1_11267 [Pistacia atlantica]